MKPLKKPLLDYQGTIKDLEAAAIQGDAKAQYELGLCYMAGDTGVIQNKPQAIWWFKKAAEQGHAAAQYNLGACYQDGIGVAKCLALAIIYYQAANKNGLVDAKFVLQDIGERQCLAARLKHEQELHTIADLKKPEIQYQIGMLYQVGNEYTEQNDQEAFRWFQLAANQGYALAQHKLGLCYRKGMGVNKNETKALQLITQSEQNGCAQARVTLTVKNKDKVDIFGIQDEDKEKMEKLAEKYYAHKHVHVK